MSAEHLPQPDGWNGPEPKANVMVGGVDGDDWRYHIPDELVDIWGQLTDRERHLLAYVANEEANDWLLRPDRPGGEE
jgi:hypothetical protein